MRKLQHAAGIANIADRGIQMLHWEGNYSLFWIIYIYMNSVSETCCSNNLYKIFLPPSKPQALQQVRSLPVEPSFVSTTSLSISNWRMKHVGSRPRLRSRAVSRRWETQQTSITKLSLFKNAFLLCLKMYPVQCNYKITQIYSHLCHLKTPQQ
jgi:hypothetical protein